MELGATICLPKKPQCLLCPVRELCEARRTGKQADFPTQMKRAERNEVSRDLLIVQRRDRVLFWQRAAGSPRLAGFWELPELAQLPQELGEFRHSIVNTGYRFRVLSASVRNVPKPMVWLLKKNLDEFALSTTAKKALACLAKWNESGKCKTGIKS
jgi:A/G-specific adenine glycosylase